MGINLHIRLQGWVYTREVDDWHEICMLYSGLNLSYQASNMVLTAKVGSCAEDIFQGWGSNLKESWSSPKWGFQSLVLEIENPNYPSSMSAGLTNASQNHRLTQSNPLAISS